MKKSSFKISKMDCPSEESLIRMKLEELKNIEKLDFDIPNRQLFVYHYGKTEPVEQAIHSLKLGDTLIHSEEIEDLVFTEEKDQKKLLWQVLGINFSFFIIEIITGFLSGSMGLVADSLDMLADAFVYGLSLFAVGGTLIRKKKVARLAGYFQIILAFFGLIEVVRRFITAEQIPDFFTMILISGLALIANSICLFLLQKTKNKEEVHIKASMIFTSNDIIINLGVIIAGLLVHVLNSYIPDLVIGSIVFLIVVRGALRILKIGK